MAIYHCGFCDEPYDANDSSALAIYEFCSEECEDAFDAEDNAYNDYEDDYYYDEDED